MMEFIKKFIKDCLTGIDGETYDPSRVYLAGAVGVFLGAACWEAYETHRIDFEKFGLGFGGLLAAGGAGIGFKASTEPGEKT